MSHQKNLEIERLRAIAVLFVFIFHTPIKYAIPVELRYSFTGVDLFFVISGFVVTSSIISRDIGPGVEGAGRFLRAFYMRRLFRIAPAAICWCLIYLAFTIIVPLPMQQVFGQPAAALKECIAYLSGFFNYIRLSGSLAAVIPHYWSLAVEEQFYLVAPLFLICVTSFRMRITLSLAIIGLCALVIRPFTPEGYVYTSTHTRVDTLLIGILLAVLLQGERRSQIASVIIGKNRLFFAMLTYLALALLFIIPGISGEPFRSNVGLNAYGLFSGFAVFVAGLSCGCVINVPIISKILEYIGARSYSIYLCHLLAINSVTAIRSFGFGYPLEVTHLPMAVLMTDFFASLVLTLLAAEVSYRLVEQRFMRIGRRLETTVDNRSICGASLEACGKEAKSQ
jgi:peptidoglycan/LPS O-acetylase OafA/YrhL